MDANTACVWRVILRNYPCTKLCVKTHSGLSMSTVLRAVETLREEGWITADAHTVPSGGKPHADLRPSARPVYGAILKEDEWDVCALLPTGEETRLVLPSVDELRPLTVVTPNAHAPLHAQELSFAECAAAYLAIKENGVYVDDALCLYTATGVKIDLGSLPSPLLTDRRLAYREAFDKATPQQKNRLTAELTTYITTILQVKRVYFADQVTVAPALAAAWASLAKLIGHL